MNEQSETDQSRADARFEEALTSSGRRDPRDFYRAQLRELKQVSADAYEQAVAYYSNTLIPGIASGELDPVQAWLDYGCRLCAWMIPGTPVDVDPTGRRFAHEVPTPDDRLVLHIPDVPQGRALLIGLPVDLSAAQQATYSLLVQGKLKRRAPSHV